MKNPIRSAIAVFNALTQPAAPADGPFQRWASTRRKPARPPLDGFWRLHPRYSEYVARETAKAMASAEAQRAALEARRVQ